MGRAGGIAIGEARLAQGAREGISTRSVCPDETPTFAGFTPARIARAQTFRSLLFRMPRFLRPASCQEKDAGIASASARSDDPEIRR